MGEIADCHAENRYIDKMLNDPTPRHVLGVPEMDAQHGYLYSLFDRIELSTTVTDAKATGKLLAEIEGYLLFHFSSEEHFIRLYGVPGFAVHQSEHERAAAKLVEFSQDFEQGRLNPAALRIFLTGWLMEHSRLVDEEYAKAVREGRKG
jgi:hemerythrin